MSRNRLKEALAAGKSVFGSAIQHFASADVPRLFASAGLDFAFIDLEHGPFGMAEARNLVRSSLDSGITPLVRVPDVEYSFVARVLDAGAQGVILPRVDDRDTLLKAIAWTRYPPVGCRGFGISPVQTAPEVCGLGEIIRHLNENTMVIAQIESQRAVERADELLSASGLDAMLVGPADLSVDLGIAGEWEHPRLVAAVEACQRACETFGVAPGIHVPDVQSARRWMARGMRLVSCGADHSFVLEGALRVAQMGRERTGGEANP